jgi:CheY-like chemotaxis protein
MDIQMPVMDGVEATHEILEFEEDEGIKHTPIVALTANALKGDRERFLAEGMDEYITKPIKREELLNIIKKFSNNSAEKTQEEELPTLDTNNISENTFKEENNLDKNQEIDNDTDDLEFDLSFGSEIDTDKNIIVAKTNPLEKNILISYLVGFGFGDIKSINKLKELGKNISKEKPNVIFIDENFEPNHPIEKILKAIKTQIPNTEIIVFSETGNKIAESDGIITNINRSSLLSILQKRVNV